MSDADISLDEKRVFEGRRGVALAFVASGLGLARVEVSDDQIGRFGLVHREAARDVAVQRGASDGTGNRVAAATGEDVLVGDGETFESTDFGPAVAVSFGNDFVAADADGRIARREDDEWATIGELDGGVTAMDGDLVATEEGVSRIVADGLIALGLDGATDVAADGPFAATTDGVYRYVDGEWHVEVAGDATAVASSGDRSVALVDGAVLERTDQEWMPRDCPAEDVVAHAISRATYAVTTDGTLLVDPPTAKDGTDGWASRSVGLADVAGLAVLEVGE